MNDIDAKSKPVVGGHHGLFRKVHRAKYEPVCENGTPIVFTTWWQAEIAAWRALRSHLRGEIVGQGERIQLARVQAGMLFPGKGRRVVVEKR